MRARGKRLRVGVVFGGRSVEHDVSLVSAQAIMAALDRRRYQVVPIEVGRDGRWPGKTMDRLLGRRGTLDVVFPIVHGTDGEDGALQGFLTLAGVPFVGAGVLGSALGMDKSAMKVAFHQAGLPIVRHTVVERAEFAADPSAAATRVAKHCGWPAFVKPANGGSSVGVSKARDPKALEAALRLALRYDRKVIAEAAVEAREIECSVLGNDRPEASITGEIVPAREFYDYASKYLDTGSKLLIPAPISARQQGLARDLAVRAFMALDLSGMARVDFFLDRQTGSLFLNEVNTLPGFTPISMYPKLWEASGLPFPALVDRLIALAFERHAQRQALVTAYRPLREATRARSAPARGARAARATPPARAARGRRRARA
jgi:D-alanine-D-alanine ligase